MDQAPYSPSLARSARSTAVSGARAATACAIAIVIGAYVLAVLFTPILRGLDTYISFSHLYIWTAALRAGDFVSTWTPIDANGFGSPVPFFYHKLFNVVSAALSLATGDIISGYRLGVLCFSALMFYGVYLGAGRFSDDRLSRLAVAAAALCAPYAIAKLSAGGSVAEYSASALIPFIVALSIDFARGQAGKRHAALLFALMVLLALAHALIFVFAAGMLLLFALIQFVTRAPGRGPLVIATLATFALFVLLMYVPFTYWSTFFSPDQARIFGRPADNLLSLKTVFWLSPRSAFGWPVFALVIGMALMLRRPRDARRSLAFGLGAIVLLMIAAMTHLARPFWLASTQLDFVQFPWRLLAVATPVCLIALAGMIERVPPRARHGVQLALLAVALVNGAAALRINNASFPVIPDAQLRLEVPTTSIIGPDAGGEYFPAAYQSALARIKVWETPTTSVLPARRPLVQATGCTVDNFPLPDHFSRLTVSADCAAPGHVSIAQFDTPFLRAVATSSNGETIAPLAGQPLIEFDLPPGRWTLSVTPRSYLDLVALAWRARLGGLHGQAR